MSLAGVIAPATKIKILLNRIKILLNRRFQRGQGENQEGFMMEIVIKAVVLGHYICLSLTSLFVIYIKRKIGESFTGTTYRMIPRKFIPLAVLAMMGFLAITTFSLIYLFDTNFHNTVLPLLFIDVIYIKMVGAAFVIIGLAFLLAGLFRLGTSTRFFLPKKETKLVTDGIYAISRNPIYLGTNMACAGFFLIVPNALTLLSLMLFLTNQHFRIKAEEKFLEKRFGKKYIRYKKRVGRYFFKI